MSDPTPAPAPESTPAPAAAEAPKPGAYIPTTEKPHVIPPVPHAWPASSAPLPEGVEIKKTTASVSAPSESVAPAPAPAPAAPATTPATA